jgi:uncharacterized protein YggU (UPF0235/DUF167 family)
VKLQVRVQTRSSQEKVVSEGTIWKVYVHEAPTDGKANEAVRKLIAKHLKVAQSAVQIVSGKSSKLKWVEIQS